MSKSIDTSLESFPTIYVQSTGIKALIIGISTIVALGALLTASLAAYNMLSIHTFFYLAPDLRLPLLIGGSILGGMAALATIGAIIFLKTKKEEIELPTPPPLQHVLLPPLIHRIQNQGLVTQQLARLPASEIESKPIVQHKQYVALGKKLLSKIKLHKENLPFKFTCDRAQFEAWYDADSSSIFIKSNDKQLKIKMGPDGVIRLINGKPSSIIPAEWLLVWKMLNHHLLCLHQEGIVTILNFIRSNSAKSDESCDRSYIFSYDSKRFSVTWEKVKKADVYWENAKKATLYTIKGPEETLYISFNSEKNEYSWWMDNPARFHKLNSKPIPLEWLGRLAVLGQQPSFNEDDLANLQATFQHIQTIKIEAAEESDPQLKEIWKSLGCKIIKDPYSSARLLEFISSSGTVREVVVRDHNVFYAIGHEEGKIVIRALAYTGPFNPNIRQSKLEISVDSSGKITSIGIEDVFASGLVEQIPQRYLTILNACFKTALMISSNYGPKKITVVQRGLRLVPQYHLNMFVRRIEREKKLNFRVNYLNYQMQGAPGVDAGGLSRDYFSNLLDGLIHDPSLSFVQNDASGLWIPQQHFVNHMIDNNVYFHWGQVLAVSYYTRITTGAYLDEKVFAAIFSISSSDLLGCDDSTKGRIRSHLQDLSLDQEVIENALMPIYALAKGMAIIVKAKGNSWTQFSEQNPLEFSERVQGTLDRQAIADAFTTESHNSSITKKINWLKEWFLDTRTSLADVRKMLVFLTGSAGVRGPNTIKIVEMRTPTPFVKVHTCSYTIEMFPGHSEVLGKNDHSKKAFIDCLTCQMEEQDFSMA